MEITHTRTHTHTKKENIESTKRDQITNSICLVKSINGFELPVDDTCIALELQNPGECQIREKYVETNRHFINGHRILRPQRFLKCSLAYCSQACCHHKCYILTTDETRNLEDIYLSRLANLLSNNLPFICLILLDCITELYGLGKVSWSS